jgi:hypothetical protein
MYIAWDRIIKIYTFFHVFSMYSVLLSADFTYFRAPGDQGGPIFFRLRNFIWRLFYEQIGVLQFASRVLFYVKLNVTNLYVTNLY